MGFYDLIQSKGSEYLIQWGSLSIVSPPLIAISTKTNQPLENQPGLVRRFGGEMLLFYVYRWGDCKSPYLMGFFNDTRREFDASGQQNLSPQNETVEFTELFELDDDLFILTVTSTKGQRYVLMSKLSGAMEQYVLCSGQKCPR